MVKVKSVLKKHALCRPIRRTAGTVKVTEWLLILIGPSVEDCLKPGFKDWCRDRDVQIISDCMRE